MEIFGHIISHDGIKFIITSLLQLSIAIGAWFVAFFIHHGSVAKQNEDLRIKLYEQRYKAYLAFKEFIEECVVQDKPENNVINKFSKNTEHIDFLFGKEIILYQKEIMANAIAIVGIVTKAPCVLPPVVGSLVGYFPGSSLLSNLDDLHSWFYTQMTENLENYFKPYLDFSKAGVNLNEIRMKPPLLPEPYLVRRPIKGKEKNG
jgi:hypothetical protein